MSKHIPKPEELAPFRLKFRTKLEKEEDAEWARKNVMLNWRQHLAKDCKAGLSLGAMAKRYCISRQAVAQLIESRGLTRAWKRARREHKVNTDFIKKEEKAAKKIGARATRLANFAVAWGFDVTHDEHGNLFFDGVRVIVPAKRSVFRPNKGGEGYYKEHLKKVGPCLYAMFHWGGRYPVWVWSCMKEGESKTWYAGENMKVQNHIHPTPTEIESLLVRNAKMAYWNPVRGLLVDEHFTVRAQRVAA